MTMSNYSVTLILLVGLMAVLPSAHSSAIKGHQQQQPQQQPLQRIEEAPRKAPVHQQQPDRSPKSVVVPVHQQQQPILESSKKVYNDEAIRRSAASIPVEQPAAPVVKSAPIVAESAPVVAAAPVVVAAAAAQPAAPVAVQAVPAPIVSQPAAVAAPAPVVEQQPAAAIVRPVEPVVVAAAAAPVKPADELPPQTLRSAIVEPVPVKPVEEKKIEQVVPQQQAAAAVPVAVESVKPVPVVEQPVPVVVPVVQAQPQEPVVVPLRPDVVHVDSPLQAKKDEIAAPSAVSKDSAEPIEVPAPDPGLVLSEPIDSTTKLLIDLDEHVQKFLPAEDKQEPAKPDKEHVLVSGVDYSPAQAAAAASVSGEAVPSGKSSVPLVPYSSTNVADNEQIVPPLPSSLEKVEKASGASSAPASSSSSAVVSANRQANHPHGQNQQQVITQLLDQLDSLQNRIQDTINQLVARRRYVMSALLRPMGTYVRRVRTNLERLQNRVNQLQAAASSVGGSSGQGQRPGGFVDAAAIETIRRRIDDISKRISDIVNRIRFSLTPTSAPLNSNGRK